ncbi:alpha-beta hydrolase superfamily lysophospholipase [Vogesella indigofera]|uniref:Alpha-beta hydrolase superfamily lysophospholipase n=1 Tax=Vogesella indigofera TaxID=45465 RepID=A0A495BJZ7_VOGIN|nr:alpha/beta fold hydrolase [Vogesella indigofera]RKQ61997.1 alpha-beta hydrolase superfamily lysophospholipase [Vogesella indigofera]
MTIKLELIHTPAAGAASTIPPLLFVHGAFSSASCWQQHFMPWFSARGYDCWALSFEGHGDSDGHDYLAAISIDDYVGNLQQAIRQLPRPPIVIAHSMGGFVLQQYLTRHDLPGAVLLASVPPSGLAGSSMRLMTHAPELFMQLNLFQQGNYQPELNELRHMLFSDDADLAAVDWVAHHSQTESQRAIMDMTLVPPFLQRRIAPLPNLVLGAAADQLISPQDITETAARFGSKPETLPHIGHMMMLDNRWEQCAQRIEAWLARSTLG